MNMNGEKTSLQISNSNDKYEVIYNNATKVFIKLTKQQKFEQN